MAVLLTRDAFREQVLARDGHLCVFCKAKAVDAHHIIERKLWPDGGYYLDNGASVCAGCHVACEQTIRSVEEVREAAGITEALLPEHMEASQVYDKWGNPVLANGMRLRGEMFFDEGAQKILREAGMLSRFCERVKYPRTYHLPWSQGRGGDDKVMPTLDGLLGRRVIVTEKMDGENTTIYRDYLHARSLDGRHHPSRDWVKGFAAGIGPELPEGWRLCGENLFAAHSIAYDNLPSYFLGFSLWDEKNQCLSWDATMDWFELLGVEPVRVMYDGPFDEAVIQDLWQEDARNKMEGYVVRTADGFDYASFRRHVGKFVRWGHVQTTGHWMHGQWKPNRMADAMASS